MQFVDFNTMQANEDNVFVGPFDYSTLFVSLNGEAILLGRRLTFIQSSFGYSGFVKAYDPQTGLIILSAAKIGLVTGKFEETQWAEANDYPTQEVVIQLSRCESFGVLK